MVVHREMRPFFPFSSPSLRLIWERQWDAKGGWEGMGHHPSASISHHSAHTHTKTCTHRLLNMVHAKRWNLKFDCLFVFANRLPICVCALLCVCWQLEIYKLTSGGARSCGLVCMMGEMEKGFFFKFLFCFRASSSSSKRAGGGWLVGRTREWVI